MSTSNRTIVVEALIATVAVIAGIAAVDPSHLGLPTMALHPAWLVVIALGARYGLRGLFAGLTAVIGVLGLISAVSTGGLAPIMMRGFSEADLLALMAATLVAWIAMAHRSHAARLREQLHGARESERLAQSTMQALYSSLGYLRRRHDRLDASLAVWRDLAGRIERGELSDAVKAVLELCEIRLGVSAGIVQVRDGSRLITVGARGQGSPISTRPRDIAGDFTVRTAITSRQVTLAPPGATHDDSEIAAPILDEDSGVVLGVIALGGAKDRLRAADRADLHLIAQWLAPALIRSSFSGSTPTARQGRQP